MPKKVNRESFALCDGRVVEVPQLTFGQLEEFDASIKAIEAAAEEKCDPTPEERKGMARVVAAALSRVPEQADVTVDRLLAREDFELVIGMYTACLKACGFVEVASGEAEAPRS